MSAKNSIIVILFILSLMFFSGFLMNKVIEYRDNYKRMESMYKETENANKLLSLKHDELLISTQNRIKELSDSLKIKPKKIKEYVTVVVKDSTLKDTFEVETFIKDTNIYQFNKDTACFSINGFIDNTDSIPSLYFTGLYYDNKIEYIIYEQRKEWNFLFIRSRFLGKKETQLHTFSKCGESTVEDIKIIKK